MKTVENWVPLKPQKNNFHSQLFGKIEWDPKFIAHASELEINVGTLNQLLDQLQINFHVEIVSVAGKRKRSSPRIHSASPNGEALITLISQNKIAKPQNWKLQNIDGHWKLLIQFSDIRDYLVEKDPNQSQQEFLQQYSAYINQQLKQVLPLLVLNNVWEKIDNSIIFGQLLGDIAHHLLVSILFTPLIISTLNNHPESVLELILTLSIFKQFMFAIGYHLAFLFTKMCINENFRTYPQVTEEYQYLYHSLKDFPLKFIFPLKSMQFFSIPLLLALTNNSKFIRPNSSAPRSSSQTSHVQ